MSISPETEALLTECNRLCTYGAVNNLIVGDSYFVLHRHTTWLLMAEATLRKNPGWNRLYWFEPENDGQEDLEPIRTCKGFGLWVDDPPSNVLREITTYTMKANLGLLTSEPISNELASFLRDPFIELARHAADELRSNPTTEAVYRPQIAVIEKLTDVLGKSNRKLTLVRFRERATN